MNNEQLFLFPTDNGAEPPPTPETPGSATAKLAATSELPAIPAPAAPKVPTEFELRQAVLAFLAAAAPSALAPLVRVRQQRYILGAAAAYIAPKGKKRLSSVKTTVAVDVFTTRRDYLPASADYLAMLEKLRAMEGEKLKMELAIRRDEPELKISCDLFSDDEFANYDYRASRKHPYAKLLREIEKTRHLLHKGSRMENIRRAAVADFLYLAVPENLVEPHELAPGWGLIYVTGDLKCKVVVEAPPQTELVSDASRNHLALNIARAAAANVLFANGVSFRHDGVSVSAPPRRRRKPRKMA